MDSSNDDVKRSQTTPTVEKTEDAESVNPLKALSEALKAEKGEPVERPGEDKSAPKGKPKNFDELAKSLAIEVKDLYAVEVPSSREGEKPYTLGALKDLAAEQDSFMVRTLEFEQGARAREAKLIRAEQEIQTLLELLPKDTIKPQALEAMRMRHQQKLAQELEKVLIEIPEWRNQSVCDSDLKAMKEFLGGFGLGESFIQRNAESSVMKFVRDVWLQSVRIERALKLATERTAPVTDKSRAAAPKGTSIKTRNGAGTRQEKAARALMGIIEQAGNQR